MTAFAHIYASPTVNVLVSMDFEVLVRGDLDRPAPGLLSDVSPWTVPSIHRVISTLRQADDIRGHVLEQIRDLSEELGEPLAWTDTRFLWVLDHSEHLGTRMLPAALLDTMRSTTVESDRDPLSLLRSTPVGVLTTGIR
ncbi:hypothetical protein [Corynebacterium terpenotabidum]|uniref:Uncharacterized protein n=1 Tax=Corynebacterium terpenotabidum Y-11 TaxID=1200352 RepID=S4XBY9_9CORY|nr:hypothetical protein [Corynebacterium terpenotabidum]AGP30106.1 hypothetical protein A606_02265 [Corynebacterium terpenotabidum Y-11]